MATLRARQGCTVGCFPPELSKGGCEDLRSVSEGLQMWQDFLGFDSDPKLKSRFPRKRECQVGRRPVL